MASRLCPLLFLLATTSIFVTHAFSTSNHSFNHVNEGIKAGFRITLKRVDFDKNLTLIERVKREFERGEQRARWFVGNFIDVTTPVYSGGGEFLMEVGIGTPATDYYLVMDTGSDLIWTQCQPCQRCYNQPEPIFNPQSSSTYSRLSCSSQPCQRLQSYCSNNNGCFYTYGYGDKSQTLGCLGTETLTFGSVLVKNVVFGCGYNNQGTFGQFHEAGLCGLAHSPIALPYQLSVKKFVYCLTSPDSTKSSTLLMGSYANNLPVPITKQTRIIINPYHPLFYYISCTGISVNGVVLPISTSALQINADGSGGMIVDSGTTYTQLRSDVFNTFANALIKAMNLRDFSYSFFKLCFQLPQYQIKLPGVTFHFDNMDLEMSDENIWINLGGGILCLAMAPSNDMSIWGNRQQVNWVIGHNLETLYFGFAKYNCDGF